MIIKLSESNFSEYQDKIKTFFKLVPFGRFLSDHKLPNQQSIELEYDNMLSYVTANGILHISLKNDVINGIIGFHFSPWDTDIFEKRMAILRYFLVHESNYISDRSIASELLMLFHDWAKEQDIQVAVTKVETKYFNPVLILQENGYIFFETNTYRTVKSQDFIGKVDNNINYRFANNGDKERLKELALKSTFLKSHFYLDKNFDVSNVDKMYAKWISNALESQQKVLVLEEENEIAGVFIYDNIDLEKYYGTKFGVWKFAALDSKFRKKGLGLALFNATINACITDGNSIIDTDLVDKNIISQNLHDNLGFKLVNTLYTFHKWF
jgi:GNAT superfamily N-acetyltransferase